MKTTTAANIQIRITRDEFGTFWYAFEWEGQTMECFDFPNREEALAGARWHIQCLQQNFRHEVCDGIGAIYRP